MRAVGAGHAWSDAALTDGYLVAAGPPRRRRPELDDVRRRRRAPLVRVLGGTAPARRSTPRSTRAGWRCRNMGGYDAQTIAGVVSTSTHGSGLRWGPFPDLVRSLELVVAGRRGRCASSRRRTDRPGAFDDRRRAVQDDARSPPRSAGSARSA